MSLIANPIAHLHESIQRIYAADEVNYNYYFD